MKQHFLILSACILQFAANNFCKAQSPLVKQWDYRFGGFDEEKIASIQQTADGGFIFGGWSLSGISGDKTQPLLDTCPGCFPVGDMWILKTDAPLPHSSAFRPCLKCCLCKRDKDP